MIRPVIVIGGGGHAKVLINILLIRGNEVLGYSDVDTNQKATNLLGIPMIGDDNVVLEHKPESVELVNALGSVGLPTKRKDIFDKFKDKGFTFASVIHPSAVIASDVEICEGAQVMAGAIIQPGSRIGLNTIVNTKTSVDHDCIIGDHVHLAPGTTISGGVTIGAGVHIGVGATLIQGVRIGDNSLIGAGSLVLKDVPNGAKVMGIPAKEMNK